MRLFLLIGLIASITMPALSLVLDVPSSDKRSHLTLVGEANLVSTNLIARDATTDPQYNPNCAAPTGNRDKCDAGIMLFDQIRWMGSWNYYLRDNKDFQDVLLPKSQATCMKVPPRFLASIKLHKANPKDETWGCALYKAADCTGRPQWIFKSLIELNKSYAEKVQSFKCWKAGT